MENLSDMEDSVPPTPVNHLNKACARIDKTSVISSKLSRKGVKNDNGFKRKRILSPAKKVKQRVKQVTLYNFLAKGNKTTGVALNSNNSMDLDNSIKVNLLNKFEETGKQNEVISSETKAVKCIDEVANSKNNPFNANEIDKYICEEVAALELSSQKEKADCVLSACENLIKEKVPCSLTACENLVKEKAPCAVTVCENLVKEKAPSILTTCENLVREKAPCALTAFENLVKEKAPCALTACENLVKEKAPCNLTACENLVKEKAPCALTACENLVKGKAPCALTACENLVKEKAPCALTACENLVKEKAHCALTACENLIKEKAPCTLTACENLEKEKAYCVLNTCQNLDFSNNEIQNAAHMEGPKDLDQTFSWLTDTTWDKDKENFEFSNIFASCDVPVDCSIQLDCDFGKFKVKEITKDLSKQEVKLVVAAIKNPDFVRTCYLKGFWIYTKVGTGDTIHILNPKKGDRTVIDNDSGFLVVNPDFLVSSTAVVSTLFCMRKAVLNHILPQWSPGNKIMMIGSLVHEVFQKSVNNHAITSAEVLKIVKSIMKKKETLIALCFQDLTESEMEQNICKYIPNIIEWIRNHCSFNGRNTFRNISITKVEDIEENVWCPKYGIKGKIDMTVNAYCPEQATSKTMALELKTGRPSYSAEHVGQVNLYSIMMEERSKEASEGLLLYLRDKSEMKLINTNHNSKRDLIQTRNELTWYINKWVSSKSSPHVDIEDCCLPSPIDNKRNCEKCSYLLPCTVYQKAFSEEKNLDPSHGMSKLIPSSTSHLTASHFEYFLHWSRLLLLESTSSAQVKAFWTESAVDREKHGMCLSYVLLGENSSFRQQKDAGYFVHTFIRSPGNPVSPNFKNSCLKEGDYVAVSNHENLDEVAVAMGYIISVLEHSVQIAIERDLEAINRLKGLTYRIDKIVSNSATACVRNNIMLLMQDNDQASKMRKLIIDKEAPNFLQVLSKQIVVLGRPVLKTLNKIQQKSVLKALMAEDYFLIKGMPGTGKTSTIVALVRLLVKMNLSVLLTSYTHSAVDNILLKLKQHVDFVRIGPQYRIQPEILEYSFENLTKDFNTKDQFSTFMKDKMVVATTCLGVNHAIFKLRKFDVCIVDEASQINQIACLGPLFYAKKFILVGDDKQLPPLVLNKEARQKGMQESLFQRLYSSSNCVELNMQYRMNREIMRLCNELTYNGCLQCGSESVANAVLCLDKSDVSDKPNPSWLLSALDMEISKSVCFLNTDNHKTDNAEESENDFEAELVILLLQYLLQCKIFPADVGIIAPYRRQVDLIEIKLKNLNISGIEANTVDQYQGRDKDVIIISCVRPGDTVPKTEKAGIILDDGKRLNVAISRARKKLVLIGSKRILSHYKPFENLISCLREDQFSDVN